ncbi:Thioesterase/thiol ester dehydrase-isomerase [Linderina pennispora]|uniref:Thioesterase/thiol ester dehydrase-isomerase n=1 Tax=Linderina pennispora TaxID=61395 RepID=A0A1Y1WEJ3_9FUNG|nr:Thioesterase/thiol ester dehydrase-isomerase [Linderina pennispora]ORX71937.1 Thioesterase/thiol ester dehydrase-isomerase [Linderina pennispora]
MELPLDIDTLLELEEVGDGSFKSRQLWNPPHAPSVFGGQLMGQALAAAFHTTGADWIAHSLHTQFLRRVTVSAPVHFTVVTLGQGRNYCSRVITSHQNNKPVMHMICNFVTHGSNVASKHAYQKEMPGFVPPEAGAPGTPPVAGGNPASENHYVLDPQGYPGGFPAEIWVKEVDEDIAVPAPAKQHLWLRCPDNRLRSQQTQQCILVTYSDLLFTRVTLRPFGVRVAPAPDTLRRLVSIGHHVWFHKPADPGDFLLYKTECPQLSHGRGIVVGEMFSRDGSFVASTAQEARVEVDPIVDLLPASKL